MTDEKHETSVMSPNITIWTDADIGVWERRLEDALDAEKALLEEWGANDKAYINLPNAPARARRILEALRLGASVQEVSDGLLLDDTIIIAVNSRKYRVKGKAGWQNYRGLDKLCKRLLPFY